VLRTCALLQRHTGGLLGGEHSTRAAKLLLLLLLLLLLHAHAIPRGPPTNCPPPPHRAACRHLRTSSDSEVLLNVLADEVHRAHQRCLQTTGCDPSSNKTEFLFEAGQTAMRMLKVRARVGRGARGPVGAGDQRWRGHHLWGALGQLDGALVGLPCRRCLPLSM